jgi:hypothetical protein
MSSAYEIDIDELKEKIQIAKKRLEDYEDEVVLERIVLIKKIQEQKKLCGSECLRELNKHLEICNGGYEKDHPNYRRPCYKCEMRSVCYECKKSENIENNGRCSHFYEIEHLEKELENIEYHKDELKDQIINLEVDYERKLAIKEGRYEQYMEDLDDYFN